MSPQGDARRTSIFDRLRLRPFGIRVRASRTTVYDENKNLPPDKSTWDSETPRSEASPQTGTLDFSTARNVLITALRTLSAATCNVPVLQSLSGVIDPLLNILDQIGLSSANAQGLITLAARIERLTAIVPDMEENVTDRGQAFVQALKSELESIRRDISDAQAQGTLKRFFNSMDHASSLAMHNVNLAQLIADATLVSVQEALRALRDIEMRLSASQPQQWMGSIRIGRITAYSRRNRWGWRRIQLWNRGRWRGGRRPGASPADRAPGCERRRYLRRPRWEWRLRRSARGKRRCQQGGCNMVFTQASYYIGPRYPCRVSYMYTK